MFTDPQGVIWESHAYYLAVQARDQWADRAMQAERRLAEVVDAWGDEPAVMVNALRNARSHLDSKMGKRQ
jgi:hypothetical protein